jgi:hypothetical protein
MTRCTFSGGTPLTTKHFRFEDVHEFPQDQGKTGAIHVGNPDGFYLIPGRYMPCFHEFVFQRGSGTGGCCAAQTSSTGKPCGGGGDCNRCITNFWQACCSDLDQSRNVSSWKSSCEGDPDKAFIAKKMGREIESPSDPSWLPSSDVACDKA